MKLLAVNIGNTSFSAAMISDRRIVARAGIPTGYVSSKRGVRALLKSLKDEARFLPDAICVSSVVPSVEGKCRAACVGLFSLKPLFASHENIGMKIRGYDTKNIGPDRLLCSMAAYDKYRDALIVIDAGSCITIDAVSKRGEFLGGAILPGIEISLSALQGRTERLPRVKFKKSRSPVGKDTEGCILSGINFGIAGAIENIISKISTKMEAAPLIVVTGGDAEAIFTLYSGSAFLERDLIFEGLVTFARRTCTV
ncbi:MAG: Type III pantothenate kinase [bacterium ADurb.Bin270]|jgi:type III pantothenate kinase|nr:type III pantothenate kinase [Myxococcales bacterium]OQA61348.1 MAG: Type III pantothenate kinase [bacterium ADurb.Bin270]